MQLFGYLSANALNSAYRFDVNLLRGELYGGIARVNTGKLDVLADGVGQYFAVFGHGIHLYFLGMFDETTHHHGVVFADIGSQLQETFKLFAV